jgi:hypothetical protein
VIEDDGEPWWNDIDGGNNLTSSHLVANQEEVVKEMMTFALQSISLIFQSVL